MKFCPVCKTSYDEEILRFCTKDGTPLVENSQPNFVAMPSREDLGEETIIRRKTPPSPMPSTAQPVPDFDDEPERISSPRIVIPMSDEPVAEELPRRKEPVRTMETESIRRQPPPKQSNTAMIVALTVLGTIVLLGLGGGIILFLSGQDDSNQNANYNTNLNSLDINFNTNPDNNVNVANSLANYNSSLNSNTNTNSNSNVNANLRTPTPTRTPTPAPTVNANTSANINGATNTNSSLPPPPSGAETPLPLPTAAPSPRVSPSNEPSNRPVNAGILNSRAVSLPKPAYPPNARQMKAEGQVAVQVSVDEAGNVTAAKATSGNPLLRASAEAAARQSKFNPVRVNNQAIPVSGVVLYNFVSQ